MGKIRALQWWVSLGGLHVKLNPISAGGRGRVKSTLWRFFLRYRSKCQLMDFKLLHFYISLSRHNLTKNEVNSLSGGHVITLSSEAL